MLRTVFIVVNNNGKNKKKHSEISNLHRGFLDPEGGSQKATLVVLLVVVISSLRVQKSLRLS